MIIRAKENVLNELSSSSVVGQIAIEVVRWFELNGIKIDGLKRKG